MNRWSALAILLAFAGALTFRLVRLDTRPLHNDEAVNALKVVELWQRGSYVYDPDEYHGPSLHYATLPFLWISGAKTSDDLNDRLLRIAPAIFGAALILLLLLFSDVLGPQATGWTALFLAISPAMVFYSRSFIHEMLLVFFTALAIGAAWRYFRCPTAIWATLCGAAVGLMFATKETFVLSVGAGVLATVGTGWWAKRRPASIFSFLLAHRGHAAIACGALALTWLLFFSSFFTNWPGLLDSIRTYLPWLKRAAGQSPHLHPWFFYFQRLGWFHVAKGPVWSEGMILALAIVGGISSFHRGQTPFVRFLTLYTVILSGFYSAISYKTPWCLLSFFWGFVLLAGVGAATVVQYFAGRAARVAAASVLLLFAGQLAVQSWRASFVYSTSRSNPYVYAQTVPDLLNLVRTAEGIAGVSADGWQSVIKVVVPKGDYWPLPWYLRKFRNVGWYEKLPDDPFAPMIMVASTLDARLDERSGRKWIMTGVTEFRPGKFFELYVELPLWTKYVETLPPAPPE